MITDIHTHHLERKGAVINAAITGFKPADGLYYSLGIHPWHIEETDIKTAIKTLETYAIDCPQVVAIGECGLDSLINVPLETQIKVFEQHIDISERLQKPLIIHCVRSSNEISRIHRKHSPKMPWIIHGFRSNIKTLRPIIYTPNTYISIGEKFNADTVKLIPDNRLMIETDESLLSIEEIAVRVGMMRNQPIKIILDIITKNNKTVLFER